MEIPLVVMGSTLINYRGFQPDEALETIRNIVDNVYRARRTIAFIWHNHLLLDNRTGWRNVYEKCLDYLLDKTLYFIHVGE